MRLRRGPAKTATLLALVLLAPGCARRYMNEPPSPGAAPAAPAMEADAVSSTTDIDALERELTENEERLALYLPERHFDSKKGEDAPAAAAQADDEGSSRPGRARPAPAKPTTERAEAPRRDQAWGAAAPTSAPAEEAESGAPNECELACRAFASMRRSAERICSLTGDADARCTRARSRVDEAAQRIARAQCACSAD
jgi:hypothetical protein